MSATEHGRTRYQIYCLLLELSCRRPFPMEFSRKLKKYGVTHFRLLLDTNFWGVMVSILEDIQKSKRSPPMSLKYHGCGHWFNLVTLAWARLRGVTQHSACRITFGAINYLYIIAISGTTGTKRGQLLHIQVERCS